MPNIRVRLKLDGMRLDYRGSDAFYARFVDSYVIRMAAASSTVPARPVPKSAPPAPKAPDAQTSQTKDTSPGFRPSESTFRHFLRQLDPRKNGAKTRVLQYAFYLWNYERKAQFREDEIAGCFLAEDVEMPDDVSSVYSSLREQRILAPGANDTTWHLTHRGQNRARLTFR